MVDLGRPALRLPEGQGRFYFGAVDPGWVAPAPWWNYEPFDELHGLRKVQSAPGWLPLKWSLRPTHTPCAAIDLRPDAGPVPASESLGPDLPMNSRRRASSWAGATWHTGFLHAKRCLVECQTGLLYTPSFRWADHGEPVKCRNGQPFHIAMHGWETWHELGQHLSKETGLQLPRLKVRLQTGCKLRWTSMPYHFPPLRAVFGSDFAPVLQLEQMTPEDAQLQQESDAQRQGLMCDSTDDTVSNEGMEP